MKNNTREIFNAYLSDVAEINGLGAGVVSPAGMQQFTVSPSIQQALEEIILENVGFLGRINQPLLDEPEGERLGLGIGSTIMGNQDTDIGPRKPLSLGGPSSLDKYHLQKSNFDTAIAYALLDRWAKFPEFAALLAQVVAKQMGRDRIMAGWHGKERKATSNREQNPMLSDVAVGWLEKIRVNAPKQVLSEGEADGVLKIGAGGDYENLDAAVFDLLGEKIGEVHQEDTEMVCILGRELMHDKYLGLISSNEAATERVALDSILATRQVGGLPAIKVPFFPKRGVMVTPLSNLSIYLGEGTARRTVVDNAARDRVEDYQSVNLDYMIEDYTAAAFIEGASVKINGGTSAAPDWK